MTEKARRGEPLSIAPFGYRIENKKLVPIPEEAEVVKKIFSDFVAGKPYLKIAKDCNEAGVKTHRGGRFENRTVDYILHNPVYSGFIRWTPTKKIRRDFTNPDSMVVKGDHPALIDSAVFAAAEKRSQELKALWRPYYKAQYKTSHWLVGLLRAPCGSSMVNSNGYFVCSAYAHGMCDKRNSIKVEALETRVLKKIEYDISNLDAAQIYEISDDANNSEIDDSIAELQVRIQRRIRTRY